MQIRLIFQTGKRNFRGGKPVNQHYLLKNGKISLLWDKKKIFPGLAFDISCRIYIRRISINNFSGEGKISEESLQPVPAQQAETLSWFDTWIQAVTRPSVATFETIIRDPKASTARAFLWVFVASLIGYAFIIAGQMAFGGPTGAAMFGGRSNLGGGETLMIFVCQTPIMAALSIAGLVISSGITNLIARALGGSGTFSQLVYAFAAYQAPLALVSGALGAIPFVIFLNFILGIYGIVLNVTAVKAVHQFGWGKAVVSSVVILFGILVLIAIVTIVILMLLGPSIQNVFDNVIQQIGTTMP